MAVAARWAALLRGVMPFNCKMPALKAAFEAAGFADVKTVLGSGNVLFTARASSPAALVRKAEAAMEGELGRVFMTIVRPVEELRALVERDPYRAHALPAAAKLVVTFLREPAATKLRLPIGEDGARILAVDGHEVFSAYVPGPNGPTFMKLLERTFGESQTTRSWDTVKKLAR